MPNFITKILTADFLSNFKVVELEHEFEPGDLGCMWSESGPDLCLTEPNLSLTK